MQKRCDTCVYWCEIPGAKDLKAARTRDTDAGPQLIALGTCRIGPPDRDSITDRGKWPLTLADDYCHGHYPKEVADAER